MSSTRSNESREVTEERNVARQAIIGIGVVAAIWLGLVSIQAPAAEAATYGTCAEAWQAPRSEGARDCRKAGWRVNKRYVVSPRNVLRMEHLKPCRFEDGSGQGACSWNLRRHQGNGVGRVYIITGPGEVIYLKRCSHGECKRWVR